MSNKETLSNNVNELDSNNDSLTTILSMVNDLPLAMTKPDVYQAGNMPVFDSNGNMVDSGLKLSIVDGGLRITYDDGQ